MNTSQTMAVIETCMQHPLWPAQGTLLEPEPVSAEDAAIAVAQARRRARRLLRNEAPEVVQLYERMVNQA